MEGIRVAVLVANGEHESPIVLRHVGIMKQLISSVRARITPGASYLSNLDNPEDFDRAIMQFLEIAR